MTIYDLITAFSNGGISSGDAVVFKDAAGAEHTVVSIIRNNGDETVLPAGLPSHPPTVIIQLS